ncbi:DUF2989 domain-containing protein [Lacimicrobium alkaliphilum]|uniref:DUF2989 domain-containing protein n=1 Tax=Lacimicrobium alkaliphilum TaxID=1526571 RepID=A0A0U2QLH5_9ALTE|nr:DUF2989 domain-containing protein [Lacimicrobium alkaliphilum]ALS98203.1 hypothetical protein AT746_08030 [Lacimicrobium alkaliphilum]
MHKTPLLCLLLLTLTACDGLNSLTVKDICKQQPQMCGDLNPDSWCRAEKALIIKNRYAQSQAPTDRGTYEQLLNFEAYKKCIAKASQIEHIKLKERKSERVKGLLTAERELRRLAQQTRAVDSPHLLYYHWSRFQNEEALKGFLAYENTPQMEYPEMQVALASYYIKFDRIKAIRLLYRALELYEDDDNIDSEIFRSLSSLFMKEEQFDWAYLWGYVGREFGVDNLNLTSIEVILHQQSKQAGPIENKAEKIIDQLQDGRFKAP